MPKIHRVLVVGVWCALVFASIPTASANPGANRVVVLLEGNTLPADVGPAVLQSLASRSLSALADGELKAALSFGNYGKTTPRTDEELRRLLRETKATYLFEIQGKAGARQGEVAVRVVAWSATERQVAIGMVTRDTSQSQVATLVLKALDLFPRTQPAAPVAAAPAPGPTPTPAAGTPEPTAPPASGGSVATSTKGKSLTPKGGFYRIQLGFGTSSLSNSDADASVSGTGPALAGISGWMFGDIGVGVAVRMAGSFSPSFKSGGMSSSPDDTELQMGLIGAGADYYPQALPNWRFSGALGILLTTVTVGESKDESHGFGIQISGGREWKLSKRWSYGVAVDMMFGSTSTSDPDADFGASGFGIMGSLRAD